MSIKSKLVRMLMPSPADVRHSEYSMLYSADDDKSVTTDRLIEVTLESVKATQKISHS